jgi:hypothetical protein
MLYNADHILIQKDLVHLTIIKKMSVYGNITNEFEEDVNLTDKKTRNDINTKFNTAVLNNSIN